MIAIQIADYFFLKADRSGLSYHVPNLVIWVLGFAAYRAAHAGGHPGGQYAAGYGGHHWDVPGVSLAFEAAVGRGGG